MTWFFYSVIAQNYMCKVSESTVEFKGILGKKNEKKKNKNKKTNIPDSGNVVKGPHHHFCFCG